MQMWRAANAEVVKEHQSSSGFFSSCKGQISVCHQMSGPNPKKARLLADVCQIRLQLFPTVRSRSPFCPHNNRWPSQLHRDLYRGYGYMWKTLQSRVKGMWCPKRRDEYLLLTDEGLQQGRQLPGLWQLTCVCACAHERANVLCA